MPDGAALQSERHCGRHRLRTGTPSLEKPAASAAPLTEQLSPSRTSRILRKRICFSIVTVATIFLAIEVTARALVSETVIDQRFAQIEQVVIHLGNQPGQIMFEPDADRFWRLKPGLEIPDNGDKRWSGRISNSLGFRNREFERTGPRHVYRIACFGDSTTFGFGVAQQDAWPSRLEMSLNRIRGKKSFQVINAGVPGYTSFQGLTYMRKELPDLRPKLVLATFGNNDGWYWDGQTDRTHAQSQRQSGWTRSLAGSRAIRLVDLWSQSLRRQSHQPDPDWAEQVWSYRVDPDWSPRVTVTEFADDLREMHALCRSVGAKLVLIIWPDRRQIDGQPSPREAYLTTMRSVCDREGIFSIDLLKHFRAQMADRPDIYLPNDGIHLNEIGNQWAAAAIHSTLEYE